MTTPPGARPNFFVLLGLAPGEPWDEAAYARVLSEKRNLWSRPRPGIKAQDRTGEAQRNLSYLGEIERVMRDPRAREEERLAALRPGEDALRQRRAVLADQLEIMLAKGFLYEEEYEQFRAEEAVHADDSLRQRLAAAERRPSGLARGGGERLDQPALDRLLDRYESSMRIARAIGAAQFERFLREAAASGIDLDAARESLIARFRQRGWAVEVPPAAAEARLQAEVRCPHCARLNAPDAGHCVHCGQPLRSQCPRCDAVVPAAEYACSACGFPVGERDYARYLTERAEASLARGDVSGADERAAEAGRLWPVPGERPDELSGRLRAVRDQVAGLRAAQRAILDQVNPLLDARRFRAAARLLHEEVAAHPSLAGLFELCEEAIRASGQRYRAARAAGLSADRRAELYEEALQLCADNDDARRELSGLSLSPAVPGPVSAQGHPPPAGMGLYLHEVELAWPPVERGAVTIVRASPDGRPLRAGAEFPEAELASYGTPLGGTSDTWILDRDWLRRYTPVLVLHGRCYAGQARCYARGPEVSDLQAVLAGTSVRVTWTWPGEPAHGAAVTEALVSWHATEIGDPVSAPDQEYVARAAGAATGSHDIPATGRLFVKVAVVVRHQGTAYVTSGIQADARRQTLTVRYETRLGRGRKGRLLLTADHLDQLPALVLRGRDDSRPAGPADEAVVAIPAGEARREIPIGLTGPDGRRLQPRSFRLFAASDPDGPSVRIIDPP